MKWIIGNWKMFKTRTEALNDWKSLNDLTQALKGKIRVSVAVPAPYLSECAQMRLNPVTLFSQNCHFADQGAYTGEWSARMLTHLNCAGSLVAHSERRQYFGENNGSAGKRTASLLRNGLRAVLCVGENWNERQAGRVDAVLNAQIREAFAAGGIAAKDCVSADPAFPLLSIAYEPVWAIGTGKSATAVEAQAAHATIRKILQDTLGKSVAQNLPVLYGGSVNGQNVTSFMQCADIDGALVGGASLEPKAFTDLIQKCV